MSALKLRPARPADLDALEALETRVFDGDQLSRRSLRAFITSPRAALIVAETPRVALAGYALAAFRAGSRIARLYSICTDPEAGRRGVGRALLSECEALARRRGCRALRLEVRADNPAALKLYSSMDYLKFAETEDYYEDGAAALRFEKRLGYVGSAAR